MLDVFAEFETNLRRERQAEGIAAARKRGIYRGRPPKIDHAEILLRLQKLNEDRIGERDIIFTIKPRTICNQTGNCADASMNCGKKAK